MRLPNRPSDLLPESDPLPPANPKAAWWIAFALAAAAATLLGMAWGGLDFWESLAGVVLGAAVAVWGMRWLDRRAGGGPAKSGDDASLRDEVRQWRRGKTDR